MNDFDLTPDSMPEDTKSRIIGIVIVVILFLVAIWWIRKKYYEDEN